MIKLHHPVTGHVFQVNDKQTAKYYEGKGFTHGEPAFMKPLETDTVSKQCWIIGGGPSARDFDFSKLEGKFVISVNRSCETVPAADVVITIDQRFIKWIRDGALGEAAKAAWEGCKRRILVGSPQSQFAKGLEVVPAASALTTQIARGIYAGMPGGRNSGLAAICWAICQGFDDIVLVGFDLGSPGEKQEWHHRGYPVVSSSSVHDRHLKSFTTILPKLQQYARIRVATPSRLPLPFAEGCAPVQDAPSAPAIIVVRPKITVFTCAFGKTDPLSEPKAKGNARFICYTDQPIESENWEIVRLPKQEAPTRASRMMKALSHRSVDSEWSLWMDANFTLLVEPESLFEHGEFVRFIHCERKRIKDEVEAVLKLKKALPETARAQLAAYQADGFDTDETPMTELSCNGVILRRHTPEVIALNEALAKELSTWTLRDQLALDFCAWKQGFKLSAWPGTHRNNPYFKFKHCRRATNDY